MQNSNSSIQMKLKTHESTFKLVSWIAPNDFKWLDHDITGFQHHIKRAHKPQTTASSSQSNLPLHWFSLIDLKCPHSAPIKPTVANTPEAASPTSANPPSTKQAISVMSPSPSLGSVSATGIIRWEIVRMKVCFYFRCLPFGLFLFLWKFRNRGWSNTDYNFEEDIMKKDPRAPVRGLSFLLFHPRCLI